MIVPSFESTSWSVYHDGPWGMFQTAKVDLDTERETYETSRNGLDTMYQDMQKKLREETGVRLVGGTKQGFPV